MEVFLVMFRDGGQHRSFKVAKPITVIGRREDCDLRIAVGDVSRKHCKLTVDDGVVRIEDLGSSNGTFVNGVRVKEQDLSAGDTLQVGPVAFVVQIDGVPDLGSARPAAKPAKPTAADIDQEIDAELDELSILNDSGGDSGIEEIDFDPNEPK